VCQVEAANATAPQDGLLGITVFEDVLTAAHLTVDLQHSTLLLGHRIAGPVLDTLLVLDSASASIVVNLFVRSIAGVHITTLLLSLVDTVVPTELELLNTMFLLGSVDFQVSST